LVVRVVRECGGKKDLRNWKNSFTEETVRGMGVVKEGKRGVRGYLEGLGASVCEEWHGHADAGEEEGECFFFDPPLKK